MKYFPSYIQWEARRVGRSRQSPVRVPCYVIPFRTSPPPANSASSRLPPIRSLPPIRPPALAVTDDELAIFTVCWPTDSVFFAILANFGC